MWQWQSLSGVPPGLPGQAAKAVQCSLEYTTLRKVTQATEIYYDPDPMVGPPLPASRPL